MSNTIKFVDASHMREMFHKLYKAYSEELSQYSVSLLNEPMTEELIDERYFYDVQLNKYFIETDNKTIGFIILQYVDTYFGVTSPVWYIVEFYIVPEYRRKGYGEAAFGFFLDFYKKDFFYYVLKENLSAKRFWERMTRSFNLKEIYRPDLEKEDDLEIETHAFEVSIKE